MAPSFRHVSTAKDFESLVPESFRNHTGKLVARLWHVDRYLPGFVSVITRIGVFIRRDEAEAEQVLTIDNYGYDVLVNMLGTLEWKMHQNEGDNLDLTNAFPADPQAPKSQRLYFGRYSPGDGPIYYGQVYEDGKSYLYFTDNILLSCPSFEILEYKEPVADAEISITVDGNES